MSAHHTSPNPVAGIPPVFRASSLNPQTPHRKPPGNPINEPSNNGFVRIGETSKALQERFALIAIGRLNLIRKPDQAGPECWP